MMRVTFDGDAATIVIRADTTRAPLGKGNGEWRKERSVFDGKS